MDPLRLQQSCFDRYWAQREGYNKINVLAITQISDTHTQKKTKPTDPESHVSSTFQSVPQSL